MSIFDSIKGGFTYEALTGREKPESIIEREKKIADDKIRREIAILNTSSILSMSLWIGITKRKTAANKPKMNPRSELPLKRAKNGESFRNNSIKQSEPELYLSKAAFLPSIGGNNKHFSCKHRLKSELQPDKVGAE